MKTQTLTAALAGTLAGLACALVPFAPAGATPGKTGSVTTTQVFDHDTATYPAGSRCDFALQRTFNGLFHVQTTTYADGTVVVHQWVSNFSYTLTNPANGRALSSHLGGTDDVTTAPDGTVTEVIVGNDINFTAPGAGRITGYVGHLRQVTLPDGSSTLEISTHNEAGSIFDLACPYLAG
jgi:hypothetical protein